MLVVRDNNWLSFVLFLLVLLILMSSLLVLLWLSLLLLFFMLLSLVLMLCVVLNTDRDRILSGTPVVARRHNGPITAAISPAAARIKTLPLASATNAAV